MQLHIRNIEKPVACNACAIWGIIYMQIDDIFFPHEKWCDAVSSVLDMWTAGLIEYIYNKATECCLYFMDGPFMLKLSDSTSSGHVLVSCMNGNGAELCNTTVLFSAFVDTVLAATHNFLDMCNKDVPNFISTETFSRIKKACAELKAAQGALEGQGDVRDKGTVLLSPPQT